MKYPGEKIRLFIGTEISPQLLGQIEQLQQQMEPYSWLKWTKTENLHLTVLFLGNVRIEMLENLISLFRLGYLSCSPVTLRSGKWAWAPDTKDPRMIWIRFLKSEEFSELVYQSQAWFSQIQLIPQQRLRPVPHITVARFRSEEKSPVDLPDRQIDGTLRIDSLKLWKSEMSESGVIYTPVATFSLSAKN